MFRAPCGVLGRQCRVDLNLTSRDEASSIRTFAIILFLSLLPVKRNVELCSLFTQGFFFKASFWRNKREKIKLFNINNYFY